jgi:hypothetical protein
MTGESAAGGGSTSYLIPRATRLHPKGRQMMQQQQEHATMQKQPHRPPIDPIRLAEAARITRETATELREHARQTIDHARRLLARSGRFNPRPQPTERQSRDQL